MLQTMTPEQRAEMQEKAAESRRLKREYAEKHLRIDYSPEDENTWRALAKEVNLTLPDKYKAFSIKYINRTLKAIGRDGTWARECWGVKTLPDIAKMNPTMNCRAICGHILEDNLEN